MIYFGSSPRMRGKPRRPREDRQRRRIIPAHAGQTTHPTHPHHHRTDHPRACGANFERAKMKTRKSGSSPRMRGKRLRRLKNCMRLRIIPAHAGQTASHRGKRLDATDHPRACGANTIEFFAHEIEDGSSPRMRGKRRSISRPCLSVRIIPAHAGQTATLDGRASPSRDHPRACGANFSGLGSTIVGIGSSPRMRGKQSDFMRKLLSAGPSIIGFAQWLQSSYYCSCLQSSAKTPISRGTTPTSLFLGFQNSITLLLLT